MKINVCRGRVTLACSLVAALVGCAQRPGNAVIPSNLAASRAAAGSGAQAVYVAESCSQSCLPAKGYVARLQGGALIDGISTPVALAVDNLGDVYVSNAKTVDDGNVTVYQAGSGRLLRILAGYKGVSYAMAFSPAGDLYLVSHHKDGCCNIKGSVSVYAPGAVRPSRWLTGVASFPGKPAFDTAGNYYQPNFFDFPGFINVYAPGASAPSGQITKGIGFPLSVTFDSAGHVYVLNGVFGGGTNVLVYAHDGGSPLLAIQSGVTNASAIAVDRAGELYVANRGQGKTPASVTVYANGASTPKHTILSGIRGPAALAFDAAGDLYVANAPRRGTNTVTVYAPNALTPMKTYSLYEAPSAMIIPPHSDH